MRYVLNSTAMKRRIDAKIVLAKSTERYIINCRNVNLFRIDRGEIGYGL